MVSMHPLRWGRAAQLILVLLILSRAPVVFGMSTLAGMVGSVIGLVFGAIVVVGVGRAVVVSLRRRAGTGEPA